MKNLETMTIAELRTLATENNFNGNVFFTSKQNLINFLNGEAQIETTPKKKVKKESKKEVQKVEVEIEVPKVEIMDKADYEKLPTIERLRLEAKKESEAETKTETKAETKAETKTESKKEAETKTETKAETKAENKKEVDNNNIDLASIIANAIKGKFDFTNLDFNSAKNEIKKELFDAVDSRMTILKDKLENKVQVLTVVDYKETKTKVGLTHKDFEKVLNLVNNGFNVWLYGEAGSGKTTLAHQIADSLKLDFYAQSVTSQTSKSDLFGYMNATGEYVESLFYKAYSNGGLFILDEVDNGNPNVLNLLNTATSNGFASFPNGMQQKHENFRLVSAGNTVGEGANRKYIGRNAIDLATKDRFIFVAVDTDWKLVEAVMTNQFGTNKMMETINSLIAKVNELRLDIPITSRTALNGAKLLKLGFELSEVLEMVLYKGNSQLKNKIGI